MCLTFAFSSIVAAQEAPSAPADQAPEEKQADDVAKAGEPDPQTLEELIDLIKKQQKQLEKQNDLIEEQRQQIEELNRLVQAVQAQLEDETGKSVEQAIEERLKQLEASVEELPDIPTDVVSAGDFPGSFRIPGTDAALKIGGMARLTLVQNLDALLVDDRFVTAEIPLANSEEAGKGPRLTMSARSSRFNFDFRTPTGVGSIRAFLETDFAGSSNVLRLRHAYGQWDEWLVGQTWSTFADPEAEPDGVDFEGLNAISLFRQPQIRWTPQREGPLSMSYAIENPRVDVTNAGGVSQFPDLIVRARVNTDTPRKGHIHAALLLRQLRAEPFDERFEIKSSAGWGLNTSGSINTPFWDERDETKFAFYAGKGIGRYISDLDAAGGQDGVYDPIEGKLNALPARAFYFGYQHWWNDFLRSTLTYGTVWVDNLDIQSGDAYHHTRRGTINLLWSPIRRLELGAEFLYGQRINKSGERGTAKQIQLGTTFRF